MHPSKPQQQRTTVAGTNSSPSSATAVSAHLRPEHVQYLQERAVPLDHPALANLASVEPEVIQGMLDLKAVPESDGLAILYDEDDYIRVRLDDPIDGGPRYLAPAGRAVPIYRVPAVDYANATRFIVVEAPIKAVSVSAHVERAVLSLGGVATTLADGALGASWNDLAVAGREVVILFDANRGTNHAVALAEARLAGALGKAGARVRIARLDLVADDESQGPDDIIASHGPGPVEAALANAVDADPLSRVKSEDLTDLATDLGFWAAVHVRSPTQRHRIRSAWRDRNVRRLGVAVFDSELKAFNAGLRAAASDGVAGPQYEILNNRICVGGEKPRVITDGVLRIVEQRKAEESGFVFVVEATAVDGRPLGSAIVSSSDLDGVEWVSRSFGAGVVPHVRSHELRSALMALADDRQVLLVGQTGFTPTPHGLAYIHGEGQVGAAAETIRVDLRHPIDAYVLPSSSARARESFKCALRIVEAASALVAFVTLACVGAAVLAHFFPARFAMFFVGKSGSLKTSLGQLILSFFGTFERRGTVDMAATYAAIEDVLFRAKDVPTLIDDYAPGTNPSRAEHYKNVLEQVIRSIGNGLGKDRMTADLQRHANRPPRGLAVITGEEPPGATESIQTRTVMLRMGRDMFDLAKLRELQDDVGLLPSCTRALVEQALEDQRGVKLRFTCARSLAQEVLGAGRSHRAAESVAHLRASFEFVVDTAVHRGAIDEDRRAELRDLADEVALQLLSEQDVARAEIDPVERFLDALYSAWAAGDLTIEDASRGGVAHGYFDLSKQRLYLNFTAVWSALSTRMRSAGELMGASQREVLRRLAEHGLLHRGDDHHFARKVSIGLERMRMTDLALDSERVPAHARQGRGLPNVAGFGPRVPSAISGTTTVVHPGSDEPEAR